MGVAALPYLAIAATAAGAGTSYAQAQKQNKSAAASAASAKAAAEAEQRQIAAAAQQKSIEAERQGRRVRGRLLAAAAARGVDVGSVDPLLTESEIQSTETGGIIRTNEENLLARSRSELRGNLTTINNRTVSPFTETAIGGLQGLQTGLQIGGGIDGLNTEADAVARRQRQVDTMLNDWQAHGP